jgi:uncharacterized protein YjbI with pentapeptide repeats
MVDDDRSPDHRTPATDYDPDTAPPRIRAWQRLLAWLTTRRLVTSLIGLAVVIFAMGALPGLLGLPGWIPPVQKLVDDLYGNFFVEALSIAVTIGVIDLLNQRRLEERERRALVDQLYSRVPGFPAEAVRLLKHRGWYRDRDVLRALQNGGDFELADLRGLRIPEDTSGLRMSGKRLDLSMAELNQADLHETHLEGAVFYEAYMLWADLSRAHLEGADLSFAHLNEADLSEAHLDGADLIGTQLEGANLRSAQMKKVYLSGVYLEGIDLSLARLEEANLSVARLKGANLSMAHLEKANLFGAHLEGANLNLADLKEADLRGANLERANGLTVSQLESASMLEGCALPGGTRLPYHKNSNEPEPDWRAAFAVWVTQGREEGWIYDDDFWGEDYIDVEKIPPRDDEGGAA